MSDGWQDVDYYDARDIIPSVFPGARVTSTSRDRNHPLSRKNPNSPHIDNPNAFDVAPIPGMTFEGFMQGLRDKGYDVEGIDEVKRPSGWATGPHWHGVIRSGPKKVSPEEGWVDVATPASVAPVTAKALDPLNPGAVYDASEDTQAAAPGAGSTLTYGDAMKRLGGQWGLDEETLKSMGFKGDEGFLQRPLALEAGARLLDFLTASGEVGASWLDKIAKDSGIADALSWDGNKFLPGSGFMALAEAFPLGGMEMGGIRPSVHGRRSVVESLDEAGNVIDSVTDAAPAPSEAAVVRQELEAIRQQTRPDLSPEEFADTVGKEIEAQGGLSVGPDGQLPDLKRDFNTIENPDGGGRTKTLPNPDTAFDEPVRAQASKPTADDIIRANPEADAILKQDDGVTSYVLAREGQPTQFIGKTENLRRELLKEASNQGKYDELYDLIMDPKDNNFDEAAKALGMKYDFGPAERIMPEYGSKNGEGIEPGATLAPRTDVPLENFRPELDTLRNKPDARPVRSLAEERAAVEANPEGNKSVKTEAGELTEFASHANDRFLMFTGKNGDVASIHVNIGKDGKAEISVDPFSDRPNRFGAVAIRQAQKALKDLYPEIDTVHGNRISGAKPGRDQELRLREEGQEPYDPATAPDEELVGRVTAALNRAGRLNREQGRMYSEARKVKAAKVAQARATTSGKAGFEAEMSALKGEMPKVDFEPIEQVFTAPEVNRLFDMIKDHPILSRSMFDPINARIGLAKLLEGRVPTKSELDLLAKVFPKDFVKAAMQHRMFSAKAADFLGNALNLPRSLMSTFDLSAPFRQGIFMVGRKEFWKSFQDMFKMFGDERAYQGVIDDIRGRDTFPLMEESNLALSDLGRNLSAREEEFLSEWAERIPGVGKVVRASGRAYTGFLNKLRADVFDDIVKKNPELASDPAGLDALAKYINNATGRGDLGRFNQAAPVLSGLLFSPRLMASRVNTLTQLLRPEFYTKTPKAVRQAYLRDLLSFGAVALTVTGLAKLAGADVEADPRSSDFGKVKTGNTRYDILGGYGQYLTLGARLLSNSTKTGKGNVRELGKGYKADSRLDVAGRFFRTKSSPNASYIYNYLDGENVVGEKFDWKTDTAKMFTPMILQDVKELTDEHGLGQGAAMAIPGVFGIGSQTYDPNKPRNAPPVAAAAPEAPASDDGWVTVK